MVTYLISCFWKWLPKIQKPKHTNAVQGFSYIKCKWTIKKLENKMESIKIIWDLYFVLKIYFKQPIKQRLSHWKSNAKPRLFLFRKNLIFQVNWTYKLVKKLQTLQFPISNFESYKINNYDNIFKLLTSCSVRCFQCPRGISFFVKPAIATQSNFSI